MTITAHAIPKAHRGMTITVTRDGQALHQINLTSTFDVFHGSTVEYFVKHDTALECGIQLMRVSDWRESDGQWMAEFEEMA